MNHVCVSVRVFRGHQKSQVHDILALGLIWIHLKTWGPRFSKFWFFKVDSPYGSVLKNQPLLGCRLILAAWGTVSGGIDDEIECECWCKGGDEANTIYAIHPQAYVFLHKECWNIHNSQKMYFPIVFCFVIRFLTMICSWLTLKVCIVNYGLYL